MAYIDIEQYINWTDKEVDESAFSRLEYRAERMIDRYTQSRVRKMEEVPESVKRCMAELITVMIDGDIIGAASKPAVQSFNNDGYSETYAQPITGDVLVCNLYGIIREYLSEERDDNGTPLLYLGVG